MKITISVGGASRKKKRKSPKKRRKAARSPAKKRRTAKRRPAKRRARSPKHRMSAAHKRKLLAGLRRYHAKKKARKAKRKTRRSPSPFARRYRRRHTGLRRLRSPYAGSGERMNCGEALALAERR